MLVTADIDVDRQLAALKRAALATWRTWAEQLSAGGALPDPVEVLRAGTLLGIREPMSALATDAAAIRDAADLDARAEAERKRVHTRLARWGGIAGARERVRELEAELRELKHITDASAFYMAGSLAGQASNLRAKYPRAFARNTPTPKKPAKRRTAS